MSLANAVIADHYGVMVGASHHEPMARAGVEWGKYKHTFYSKGTEPGANSGAWNYYQNVANLSNFWSDSIARNGNFTTNLYTVGMRGAELSSFDYFDINAVMAYLVKVNLVARWSMLDPERGRAMFEQLIADLDGKDLINKQ